MRNSPPPPWWMVGSSILEASALANHRYTIQHHRFALPAITQVKGRHYEIHIFKKSILLCKLWATREPSLYHSRDGVIRWLCYLCEVGSPGAVATKEPSLYLSRDSVTRWLCYLCEVGSPGAVATKEPSLYQSIIGSGSPLAYMQQVLLAYVKNNINLTISFALKNFS